MLRKTKTKADSGGGAAAPPAGKKPGLFSSLKQRSASSQNDPASTATPGALKSSALSTRPKSMFARVGGGGAAPSADGGGGGSRRAGQMGLKMPSTDDDDDARGAVVQASVDSAAYDSGPEEAINFPKLQDSRFINPEEVGGADQGDDTDLGDAASDDSSGSEIEVPVARFGCGYCPGCKKNPELDRPARTRSALGNKWHLTCFNCPKCRKPVRDRENLFSYRNFPYHRGCYYEWFGERCEVCDEPVPDKEDKLATDRQKQFEVSGKFWHTKCFACTVCKKKLDCNGRLGYAYAVQEGEPYCIPCHVRMKKDKCGRCQQPFLDGKFIMALNKRWHLNHFCCHVCDKPFGQTEFKVADGAAYCDLHMPRRMVGSCAVCQKKLFDDNDYFENAWGQLYCESHDKQLKSCVHCGTAVCRLPSKNDAPLAICDHCAGSAVTTSKDLPEIFAKVRAEMIDLGIDITSAKVSLSMVNSRETFEKVASLYHKNKESALESRSDASGGLDHKIRVLTALPVESVEATLAHEIVHIYIAENNFPRRISPMVLEGLGEYAAYWYITHSKGHLKGDEKYRVSQIKNNTETVLGSGFAACKEAVMLTGSFSIVIKHVKKTKWFPNPEKEEG